jgi:sec-independent protein translocase protein TatA
MGLDNPIHIAFLLIILLLVFGAKRLPEMGKSLGEGLRGFKSSINGEDAPVSHAGIAAATVATPVAPQQEQVVHPLAEVAPTPQVHS